MRFAIHFDGEVPVSEVARALADIGLVLVSDGAGRTNAIPVPPSIAKHSRTTNVLTLPRRKVK
jgi:hypothetical protein